MVDGVYSSSVGSTTNLPFSAFSDYVTFSSMVEMSALVVGLSS